MTGIPNRSDDLRRSLFVISQTQITNMMKIEIPDGCEENLFQNPKDGLVQVFLASEMKTDHDNSFQNPEDCQVRAFLTCAWRFLISNKLEQ